VTHHPSIFYPSQPIFFTSCPTSSPHLRTPSVVELKTPRLEQPRHAEILDIILANIE
jgi:hypothetical protein